jgi:curli biogenesis system outer membrane secretion channel CsgG
MRKLVIVVALLLAGCSSPQESQPTAPTLATKAALTATEAPSRPDDPTVYARIAKMTDCGKLQEHFDLAETTSQRPGGPEGATWSEIGIAYLQAADARMKEVGCYR